MDGRWKWMLRGLTPPVVMNRWKRYRCPAEMAEYVGNYPDWARAQRDSDGYDAAPILERVRFSLGQVRDGRAGGERDGVVFDRPQHAFPLLAGLARAAALEGNRLSVLDFGGSLGSTYFQCRAFLASVRELSWSVVEQPAFVEVGRREFQTDQLRFYPTADACLRDRRVDLLLLSSVLPYVSQPHALLKDLVARSFRHIIIDRTPLLADRPDRLTVQRVPPHIYGAQVRYPAWVLNREGVLNHFRRRYELVLEFDALAGEIALGGVTAQDTGLIFTATSPGVIP